MFYIFNNLLFQALIFSDSQKVIQTLNININKRLVDLKDFIYFNRELLNAKITRLSFQIISNQMYQPIISTKLSTKKVVCKLFWRSPYRHTHKKW